MRKHIEARDGYILTDGDIYGICIYLAEGADESSFYEIPKSEYEVLMQNEQTDY